MRLNDLMDDDFDDGRPTSYVRTLPMNLICRPEGPKSDPHFEKLLKEFRAGAKFPPVEVMMLNGNNNQWLCAAHTRYVLLDGHHRLSVYDAEGITETKVRVWEYRDNVNDILQELE